MSLASTYVRPEPRWWWQFHTSKLHPGSWRRQLGPCCQLSAMRMLLAKHPERIRVTPVFTWEWF